ncbi:MAG: S41 family peptidase, partial [Kiritimatiellae bacterium]|nr:S41 family peptidase [Kiritimatiellia bacterium]
MNKFFGMIVVGIYVMVSGVVCFAQSDLDMPDDLLTVPVIPVSVTADDHDVAYDNMELLTQVMLLIKKNYHQDKTFDEITHAALHGLLNSLDDHSDFMSASAYDNLKDDTSGKFGGIGIHIGIRDGILTVIAPIEDTPAYRAGVQSGDRIIKIDGTNSVGYTLREAVNKLRGHVGEGVTVTLRRLDKEQPITVDIIRDDIKVPTVKGARIIRDGIGYIRIIRFAEPTVASLDEALADLKEQGMNALILDLRNNPGGLLKSAIMVADRFLNKGQLIVSTKGRNNAMNAMNHSATHKATTEVPIVILINGGSASASEIVAGALQDHKRAILMGDTSYGKGSVQSVIKLKPDGKSAIRLTTALYYTPSGRTIHKKGIDPDIPVYVRPSEWRLVQRQRAREERPELFKDSDADKEELDDVVDQALVRALDVLQAMKAFKK